MINTMDVFITILIGAARFLGVLAIVLPIATGIIGDTGSRHYDNKLAKFYFVTWPLILVVGLGCVLLIFMFYKLGEYGFNV